MVAEYLDSAGTFFLTAGSRRRREEEGGPQSSIGFPSLDEYADAAGAETAEETGRQAAEETNSRQSSIDVLSGNPLGQSRPTVLLFDNFDLPVAPGGIQPAFGRTMPEIANRIEDDTIPMGSGQHQNRGDVMNVSAGYGISFQDASVWFGLNITQDNVKEMVPQILRRVQELSEDPTQPANVGARMQHMFESNRAVERIRGRGVEAVAAGGRDGADMFNMAYLTATTQLPARNVAGEIASWTASNSLPTSANGHHRLFGEPEYQRHRLGDSGVYFGGQPDFERYVAGWAAGTSFSNVDYLWQQYDRLRRMKIGSS